MSHKPDIGLITTGGTIAMAAGQDDDQRGVFRHGADNLLAAIPQLSGIAKISPIDMLGKPSHNLTFEDFRNLHLKINEVAADFDGIVITTGTDVMEEIAFGLSLVLDLTIPVVLTGAMRRADLPGADGPANLLHAVQVAASEKSAPGNVLAVMNGEIFSGLFLKKQHSFLPQAFSCHPVGWVAENRVRLFYESCIKTPQIELGAGRSVILTMEGGFDNAPEDLKAVDFSKLDAFIFDITGVGHTSDRLMPMLGEISKKIPCVFTSRTKGGETFRDYYGSPGTESDLIANGWIPGGHLNSRQARMLMLLAGSSHPLSIKGCSALFSYFNS